MCNPAAAVIGMNIVGGAYAYESQMKQGKSQQAYYNYLAKANDVQAQEVERTAETQTGLIQDAARVESRNLTRQGKRLAGTQKAVQAANGVGGGSVTSEDIERDTMTREELDQAALRFNADSRAWETLTSAKATARGLRQQGIQFQYAGANAMEAAKINANTSLLGSATNVADSWYKWNRTSVGDSSKPGPKAPRTGAMVSGQYVGVAPDDYYKRSR